MKTTKKVLGVVVALTMLVNVFAMFSFAVAPESAIDLTMRTDKDAYNPGDIVTITVSEKVDAQVGPMTIAGSYAIGYNSAVIDMLTTDPDKIDLVADHAFVALQAGFDNSSSGLTWTDDNLAAGDTIDGGYDWDRTTILNVAYDQETSFDATEGVDLFTFQMKLADNVQDGDYVIGFNEGSFFNCSGFVADKTNGGVYGTDQHYYNTTNDYSFGRVTIHVGAAAEPSIIQPISSQIRFKGVKTEADFADYNKLVGDAKTFDVRTRATISKEDFNAKFTDETTAEQKITEVGFIYRANNNPDVENYPAFSYEEALLAAQDKSSDATYRKKRCNYMQSTDAGYNFTCLITGIVDNDANRANGVTCVAYICVDNSEYIFLDKADVITVNYGDLYNMWHK